MHASKKSWIELACATALVAGSTALVLAQGGPPPPVPVCIQCRPSPGYCGMATVNSETCCCCYNGSDSTWKCNAQVGAFNCVYPPPPWSACFQVL